MEPPQGEWAPTWHAGAVNDVPHGLQPPPGWYPDPSRQPNTERWWDGFAWTNDQRPLPAGLRGGLFPPPAYAHWGWRMLSGLLDALLIWLIGSVAARPWLTQVGDGLQRWATDYANATTRGVRVADLPSLFDDHYGVMDAATTAGLVIGAMSIVYAACMLATVGATLGQLACRLRVKPEGALDATRLPWLQAFGRQLVLALIDRIPLLNLLNYLMPLWTAKRQCLHDMAVRTVVVRIL